MNKIEETDLIRYIKDRYPKVIFDPIKLTTPSEKSALGFVISDNKFILGYITKDGNLCKLIDPIDLNNIDHESFLKLISSIPVVEGFTTNDKERLLNLLNISNTQVSREDINNELRSIRQTAALHEARYREDLDKYKVMIDTSNLNIQNLNKNIVLIKKQHEDEILQIKQEYENKIKELENANETCKNKLVYEKEMILDSIKKYKEEVENYMLNQNNTKLELEKAVEQLRNEKLEIEKNLQNLQQNELVNLEKLQEEQELHTDFSYQLNQKQQEINQLNETIYLIRNELQNLQEQFSKEQIEQQLLNNFKSGCIDKILAEKDIIIQNINEYNEKWLQWSNQNYFNINEYKQKLNEELDIIFSRLKDILRYKNEYILKLDLEKQTKQNKINELEKSINQIRNELTKAAKEQLESISLRNEEVESNYSQLSEDYDSLKMEYENQTQILMDTQKQLEEVRKLLYQNQVTPITKEIDYNNCRILFEKFKNINNMFYRKKEIIRILDSIIYDKTIFSVYTNLNDEVKNNIEKKYSFVRDEIWKYIEMLDLNRFTTSPYINLFNSELTIRQVPPKFCEDLEKISKDWDANASIYRVQDTMLTDIYEDLSGAVRVYIRIKPLIGKEQINNTVYIDTVQNKKQKRIVVDCMSVETVNRKETFGDFYGIFDESFSNLDIYTGIQNSKTVPGSEFKVNIDHYDLDSVSPGLYSSFKQAENGYSIVIFGYGLSGSGKTFSLIGQGTQPGLIHYGLANLEYVENIKIKYVFEQYINKFTPTLNHITGNIINLVNVVPQCKDVSIDERREFADEFYDSRIDLNNIKVEEISKFTNIIEKYRIKRNRIRKTPNNPVSSRSHLYITFEIQFRAKDGFSAKTGYITIIDTAGRESPLDIYNLFIDTSGKYKTNLTTILGPTGGPEIIERYMKSELKLEYNPSDIYNIFKEGVYVNETINHLIYYLSKKNYKQISLKDKKQTSLEKYSADKYYVDPRKEDGEDGCGIVDPLNNALMIPIMKFLDKLSNKNLESDDFKPTKFITLVCVRKDQEYCNQIFSSMEFAQNIKST